jgi:hypothetical protein
VEIRFGDRIRKTDGVNLLMPDSLGMPMLRTLNPFCMSDASVIEGRPEFEWRVLPCASKGLTMHFCLF